MQEIEIRERLKNLAERAEKGFSDYIGSYIGGKAGKKVDKHTVKRIMRGLISGFTAFLFGGAELGSGIRPFGAALLCAAEKNLGYMFIGLVLSALARWRGAAVDITAYFAVLVIRILLHKTAFNGKFAEPTALRAAVSSVPSFIIGMYSVINGGFEKLGLYNALILMAATPAFTCLYAFVIGKRETVGAKRDIGLLAVVFTVVLSLKSLGGGIIFGGFSLAVIGSTVITLCAAVSGGSLKGGIVGMICGLACGNDMSAMLGISGVVAGSLKNSGGFMSMLGFCGTGITFSLLSEGAVALGGTIPDILWGTGMFAPITKLGLLPKIAPMFIGNTFEDGALDGITGSTMTEAALGKETDRRLMALSDALSSLSSVFYALSNRIGTPGIYEVRTLCEKTFKKHCKTCTLSTVCWGREFDRTSDAINKLATAIAKNGTADSQFIPSDFLERCPSVMTALSEVNITHARMLEAAARENKTEVFALDYEAMAKLLEISCAESAEEYTCDKQLSERVRRAVSDAGLLAVGMAVYGKRKKTVVAGGVDISGLDMSSSELCKLLEKAVGTSLTVPEFTIDGDYVTMTARSKKIISAESARASLKKENETVNGDSVSAFSNREEYFYALISDGMGSGRDAAITSRTACIFLEKMLSAGNRKDIVLKMLNNFIRNKNLECFATVDLLEIDLLSSTASFIKSGAAASYIIRDKKLFKIASNSLPIGITREITAEEIRFDLKPNDLIVMISDGVAQSFEDGLWLTELLSSDIDPSLRPDDIAALILDSAKVYNKRSDDMTVSAIKIDAA